MEIGLGHLRYPPDVFWRMTTREYEAACEGLLESYGGKNTKARGGQGMSSTRLNELMAQFPDEPVKNGGS